MLGGNIGNETPENAIEFCRKIRASLQEGDLVLIGFDLKKNPHTILAAYNDAAGFTRDFNLNLLHRINSELGGDFDTSQFEHYPNYDPITGACKSYLVSKADRESILLITHFNLWRMRLFIWRSLKNTVLRKRKILRKSQGLKL